MSRIVDSVWATEVRIADDPDNVIEALRNDTPLNEAFQTFAWTKPSAQAAE